MAKKKKKKAKQGNTQQGGYKRFVKDYYEVRKKFTDKGDSEEETDEGEENFGKMIMDVDDSFVKEMYRVNLVMSRPVRLNDDLTPKELTTITTLVRENFHKQDKMELGIPYSTYQYKFLYLFFHILAKEMKKDDGPLVLLSSSTRSLAEKFCDAMYANYIIDVLKVLTKYNNPAKRFIYPIIRLASINQENSGIEMVTELAGIKKEQKYFKFDKGDRPAFRMSNINQDGFKWLSIPSELLGESYKGDAEYLNAYIQSHALRRLQERLDLLSPEAINFSLWENTFNIQEMCSYKDRIYLPYNLHNVRVGYLVASIIDEDILFRSFIFVTHNSTPEGDKLKDISGLSYKDISYWKIDRLSTFVNIKKESQQDLLDLFKETGMDKLEDLLDEEFDLESLEAANLDKLMDYINEGKNFKKLQVEDFQHFFKKEAQEAEVEC